MSCQTSACLRVNFCTLLLALSCTPGKLRVWKYTGNHVQDWVLQERVQRRVCSPTYYTKMCSLGNKKGAFLFFSPDASVLLKGIF